MLKSPGLRRFSLLLGALGRFGWLYNAAPDEAPTHGQATPVLGWAVHRVCRHSCSPEDTLCLPTFQGSSPDVPAPERCCLAGRRQLWRYGCGRKVFPKCDFLKDIWGCFSPFGLCWIFPGVGISFILWCSTLVYQTEQGLWYLCYLELWLTALKTLMLGKRKSP